MNVAPFKAEVVGEPELRDSRFGPMCRMLVQPVELDVRVLQCVVTGDAVGRCKSLAVGEEFTVLGGWLSGPFWVGRGVPRCFVLVADGVAVASSR